MLSGGSGPSIALDGLFGRVTDPHQGETAMATERQKAAARKNVKKAQSASASRRKAGKAPKRGKHPMASHTRTELSSTKFAFPSERKEPLTDARHVRNAVARFNQVEGVSQAERNAAWRRITAAAKKYGVEISHRPGAR
jgi:hypothetical protein